MTAAAVSKSFTAVSVSNTVQLLRGASVTLALSGTYAATITLERATSPDGSAFETVLGPFSAANATVSQSYTARKQIEILRMRCTAFTSGTCTASMTPAALQGTAMKDPSGATVAINTTEDGVQLAGGLEVGAPYACGSTITLSEQLHAMRTGLLDTAAGSTVTLPTSTGGGAVYRFVVKTKATSNNHIIKVGNTTDIIQGVIETMSDDPVTMKGFAAGATDDTITLNRTTTGSVNVGEWIEIVDYAAGFFGVRGVTSSTGTEATPFSATV